MAMTAEELRQFIINSQRPNCKNEPGANAIANSLGAMQSYIFEPGSPE